MHNRSTRSPGFTLVELLFVLVILATLGGISYPPVMDWVASSRVDNAARVVASDFRLAVSLASRQGTPVRINFDAAGLEYELVERNSARVLQRRTLGAGTELPIQSTSASTTRIDVFPNRATSGPMSITVAAGRHSARVDITSAGFIRVTDL